MGGGYKKNYLVGKKVLGFFFEYNISTKGLLLEQKYLFPAPTNFSPSGKKVEYMCKINFKTNSLGQFLSSESSSGQSTFPSQRKDPARQVPKSQGCCPRGQSKKEGKRTS